MKSLTANELAIVNGGTANSDGIATAVSAGAATLASGLGTVAGTMLGGPVGAVVGAAIGATVGTAIGQYSKEIVNATGDAITKSEELHQAMIVTNMLTEVVFG